MGNQTNNQKVTKLTMKTFVAAAIVALAAAQDDEIRARWSNQRDLASMARDLEDCFPTAPEHKLRNSLWRPTTIVKPGRMWAVPGQGPSSRVDCDGKEVGDSRLIFQTYRKTNTTRPAAYPYARTLLETRQPSRCYDYYPTYNGYGNVGGYGHGYGSCGYHQPHYGCAYGNCGYQQPQYG